MSTLAAQPDAPEFHPLTPDRWDDCEQLFSPRGACTGCWCMWWRLARSEFDRQAPDQRRMGLKTLVEEGRSTGILAYRAGNPVAWCSIAPRDSFVAVERFRVLRRIDDRPARSIVCFFVHKDHRRQGLAAQLVQAAAIYAASQGATIVEAYNLSLSRSRPPGPALPGTWAQSQRMNRPASSRLPAHRRPAW